MKQWVHRLAFFLLDLRFLADSLELKFQTNLNVEWWVENENRVEALRTNVLGCGSWATFCCRLLHKSKIKGKLWSVWLFKRLWVMVFSIISAYSALASRLQMEKRFYGNSWDSDKVWYCEVEAVCCTQSIVCVDFPTFNLNFTELYLLMKLCTKPEQIEI